MKEKVHSFISTSFQLQYWKKMKIMIFYVNFLSWAYSETSQWTSFIADASLQLAFFWRMNEMMLKLSQQNLYVVDTL